MMGTQSTAPCCPAASCQQPRSRFRHRQLHHHDLKQVSRSLEAGIAYLEKINKWQRMSAEHREDGETIARLAPSILATRTPDSGSVRFFSGSESCPTVNPGLALSLAVADWSVYELNNSREMWRNQLLRLLKQHVPLVPGAGRRPLILMPGAGLMRLPFEAARLGYDVVANECDPTHLALSDLILNDGRVLCALEQRAARRTDHRAHHHLSSTTCTCAGSLQAVAGRVEQLFAEVGSSAARFDAIVTSFVMDRGPTVSEWLRHIDRALRPGGLWIGAEAFQVKGHDASFGLLAGEQMADAALDRLRQWRYNLLHVDGMRGQPYADGAKRYNLTLIAARKAHFTAIEQSVYPSVLVALLPPLCMFTTMLLVVSCYYMSSRAR